MKVSLNRRTNLPALEIDDNDYANAMHVKQMIGGKHTCTKCGTENDISGWKVLEGYFASMRLWIEEIGKVHARSRAKKDLCSNDFSILDGFDIAIGIPQKIILQAEVMRRESEKVSKEAQNDAGPADEFDAE